IPHHTILHTNLTPNNTPPFPYTPSSTSLIKTLSLHDALTISGNKQLGTMIIEIHGSPFRIGSGNDSQAVHFMFDGLTFLHYLHNALLVHPVQIGFESLGVGAPAATRTPLKQARG